MLGKLKRVGARSSSGSCCRRVELVDRRRRRNLELFDAGCVWEEKGGVEVQRTLSTCKGNRLQGAGWMMACGRRVGLALHAIDMPEWDAIGCRRPLNKHEVTLGTGRRSLLMCACSGVHVSTVEF